MDDIAKTKKEEQLELLQEISQRFADMREGRIDFRSDVVVDKEFGQWTIRSRERKQDDEPEKDRGRG